MGDRMTNQTEIDAAAALLDTITDPISGKGLIASGRAAAPRLADGRANVILDVTGLSGDARLKLESAIKTALATLADITDVRVAMTSTRGSGGGAAALAKPMMIAVASGKGGVGKSTVSTNLAVALAKLGKKVGVIDADIYGPSQPRLLGVEGHRPTAKDQKLEPVESPYGVKLLSMGQLAKPGQAIAWRGPMASNALGQLVDAVWGDTEVLIVDMPPGTGDIQMSMIQKHKPDAVVIVSTPQDLALMDATRAIDLFNSANVPIIGLIENMAGYQCPHCGEVSDPFGQGGAQAAAKVMDVAFLGRIPLEISIRQASDAGEPPAASDGDTLFAGFARQLLDWKKPS
jgi:ATP-binding protein involved in chromosome partitioning